MGRTVYWVLPLYARGQRRLPALLPSPRQRETTYHRIREIRSTKPIFAMDFQNDGEYVGGCREKTLLDCLRSPIFMACHDGQPFNDNHLRPCPMLENPEKLREMVHHTGAHSTDLQSPESVDHLCDKCASYAQSWEPEAERLWEGSEAGQKANRDKR